jgi:hypothetical protein
LKFVCWKNVSSCETSSGCRLKKTRNLAYANALCAQHNFEGAMDAATAATAGFKVAFGLASFGG